MRIRSLSDIRTGEILEVKLQDLPDDIYMTEYAFEKAFKISQMIRSIFDRSFEWYGFTIAKRDNPELIVDIGLPVNEQNVQYYASINPQMIAEFQQSLDVNHIINGWIHSHGDLGYKQFSDTDEKNQITVLDYVSSVLRKPVAKREIPIRELFILTEGRYERKDLEKGSVTLITDIPVSRARIMETVYGSFSYSILIGDEGWHIQQIHYKMRGILSGQIHIEKRDAELVRVRAGITIGEKDIEELGRLIRERVNPAIIIPERFEKGCT